MHKGKLHFVKRTRSRALEERFRPPLTVDVALWRAITDYADAYGLTVDQVVAIIAEANIERKRWIN